MLQCPVCVDIFWHTARADGSLLRMISAAEYYARLESFCGYSKVALCLDDKLKIHCAPVCLFLLQEQQCHLSML